MKKKYEKREKRDNIRRGKETRIEKKDEEKSISDNMYNFTGETEKQKFKTFRKSRNKRKR